MSIYKPYSREEKKRYAKRFTAKERVSYRTGKRYGFLCGIHAKRKYKGAKK